MVPLRFLAQVLPPPGNGYYCAAELSRKKEHVFGESIEDLQTKIDEWNERKYDVYFALATFKENRSREAVNAQTIKSFFIDMDGYETKKAAALALSEFLEKTGLSQFGIPWIVSSGGGIHAYWPFTETVNVGIWKPAAENFKRLCKQEGLLIDWTVSADTARVLRVPGTWNHKKKYSEPREVKVLAEGDTFVFEDFVSCILGKLTTPAPQITVDEPLNLPGKRPTKSVTQLKLVANSTTVFKIMEERAGCGQIKHYRENATQDGMEPIWRGLLSWAKVCEDVQEAATDLTALHPYTEDRMRSKLAEIKGPYPCTKMDSENPGVCTSCVHWGQITNPHKFGRDIQTDNTEKEITINPLDEDSEEALFGTDAEDDEDDLPKPPPITVTRPEPPRGYSYGATGGVYCKKEEKDEEGKKITKQVQILPYDLFVIDILKYQSDHLVHMVAVRPEGPVLINMPQKAAVSKEETVKWLANQNILASFGQGNDKNLFDYVRACVEQASLNKKVITVPLQAGWQENGSFVYNGRIFNKDGTVTTVPMPGLENITRITTPKGNLEDWRKVWNMFIERKMYTLLAVALDSFGCPLMHFTEYEGFVWHIGANKSGTGKSLTLSAKAGVWGHPVHYRTGKGTSPVAMQNRAGNLNSMPLLVDEITGQHRKDMEWAPAFIFDMSEGKGKERMEAGANKERVNDTTWGLTCTLTSNENLTDYMAGARKFSSNGELLRMLEWTPNVKLHWTPEEREILKLLKRNYGVAGEAWVRWMVQNRKTIKDLMPQVHTHLEKEFNFTDDERYWHVACTEVVAAAIMLGKKHANILEVPVKAVIAALKELVVNARNSISNNVRSADDVLNSYTRDNYGGFIVLKKADGRLLAAWGDGDTVDKSITRSKVLGRVEHGIIRPGYVDYFVEENLLKQHCVSMSYAYHDFKTELAQTHTITYVKKDMLSKTGGPPMRVNALHISRKKTDADEDLISVEKD